MILVHDNISNHHICCQLTCFEFRSDVKIAVDRRMHSVVLNEVICVDLKVDRATIVKWIDSDVDGTTSTRVYNYTIDYFKKTENIIASTVTVRFLRQQWDRVIWECQINVP